MDDLIRTLEEVLQRLEIDALPRMDDVGALESLLCSRKRLYVALISQWSRRQNPRYCSTDSHWRGRLEARADAVHKHA